MSYENWKDKIGTFEVRSEEFECPLCNVGKDSFEEA